MSEHKITILSEYQIKEGQHEVFIDLVPALRKALQEQGAKNISFFEGTDQPGLFVEQFDVRDMTHYQELKQKRYEETADIWKEFHTCIAGGKDKVHIWAFSRIM